MIDSLLFWSVCVFFFIWIILANMCIAVPIGIIVLYDCEIIMYFFTCFDLQAVSLHFYYCSGYVIYCFYEVFCLYDCQMIRIISPVLIARFFTCIDLYFFLFLFIFVASMFAALFIKSLFFAWLWNDHYLISGSLIDCILSLICMLFLFTWIIVVCTFATVLTRSDFFVWLWNYC